MSKKPKPSPAGNPRDQVTGGRAARSPGRMGGKKPPKGFQMGKPMTRSPKTPRGSKPGDGK